MAWVLIRHLEGLTGENRPKKSHNFVCHLEQYYFGIELLLDHSEFFKLHRVLMDFKV